MLESRRKSCAYSRHQCLDKELGDFSELGKKDILINEFDRWFDFDSNHIFKWFLIWFKTLFSVMILIWFKSFFVIFQYPEEIWEAYVF